MDTAPRLTEMKIPVPAVPIKEEHKALFKSINEYVYAYMSQPGHDNSHDYHHILRVLSNAHTLYQSELVTNPNAKTFDTSAIYLAALLHDVGDHKYAIEGEDPSTQVLTALQSRACPRDLAEKVQTIVKHVGYTNEVRNPDSVLQILKRYPELAIVQDADRLDAIGAVGIGRCFAFGGAKGKGRPLAGAIEHFEEKLVRLGGMMKTARGREMAVERTRILDEFTVKFDQEARLSFALE